MGKSHVREEFYLNGFHIYYDELFGYKAYKDDKLVYEIKPSGTTFIVAPNGNRIPFENLTIYDIKPDMYLENIFSEECYFSGDAITSKKGYDEQEEGEMVLIETIYTDDSLIRKIYNKEETAVEKELIYYNDDTSIEKNYVSGVTIYRDYNYDIYRVHEKGVDRFFKDNECVLTLYSDGTYEENGKKGIYTIDDEGNIVCCDEENNKLFHNKYGEVYQRIDKDGAIYKYDFLHDKQAVTKNGKTRYSKINHIEYDEEAYDNILKTFNEVDDSIINNLFLGVEHELNALPDKNSCDISSLNNSVDEHINAILALEKMTNYSLLAYQTCDEELKQGLEILIDSLFGDDEAIFANTFKKTVNNFIEEKDGILEYRESVDFRRLSDNAFVANIYTDSEGNKWYLSRKKDVIRVDGKELKISYGGEEFTLEYDENGMAIIKDSNGNDLDIFADYNIDSTQFGGSQCDLVNAFCDENVTATILKYFPDASTEDMLDLLIKGVGNGCGYTAVTDYVFKRFEGKEKEFYDTFGFPMYKLKLDDQEEKSFTIDYNYEPIIMDLYCKINSKSGQYNIEETIKRSSGAGPQAYLDMINYLNDTYGVKINDNTGNIKYVGDYGYKLYDLDGSLYFDGSLADSAHAMIIVGDAGDGRYYVSTWGRKLIYEPSPNADYREMYYSAWELGLSYSGIVEYSY